MDVKASELTVIVGTTLFAVLIMASTHKVYVKILKELKCDIQSVLLDCL